MGCVTSKLFCKELGNEAKASNDIKKNHTVCLTSSTYGLLNLEKPDEEDTTGNEEKKKRSPPRETKPEVINAWELMEGLEEEEPESENTTRSILLKGLEEEEPESETKKKCPNTTRSILLKGFADIDPRSPLKFLNRVGSPRKSKTLNGKENRPTRINNNNAMYTPARPRKKKNLVFEKDLSPSPAESPAVLIYTTTLRGIRKTFEDCNKVRSAMESQGVRFSERDVSMDSGFKEELRRVTGNREVKVPAVFIKGVAIGGDEVIRLEEEGKLGILLEGLPRMRGPERDCKGCGGVRFVVCGECHGSCKVAAMEGKNGNENVVKKTSKVRCLRCNENGLLHCPLCRF